MCLSESFLLLLCEGASRSNLDELVVRQIVMERIDHPIAPKINSRSGSHALIRDGATLVDATLAHVTPMTASELRELAKDLPQPPGSALSARSPPGG